MIKSLFFVFLSMLYFYSSLDAGVAMGSLIPTTNDYVRIEHLSIGDEIIACKTTDDIDDSCLTTTTIKNIIIHVVHEAYVINTATTTVYLTDGQRCYDPKVRTWVRASELSHRNTLIDNDFNWCRCLEIELIKTEIAFYDLELEDVHTFFVSNGGSQNQILVHDFYK